MNTQVKEVKDKITPDMEAKYVDIFNRQARYMCNGIYGFASLYSTDTRELFLMFVAQQEFNINFE